MRGSHSSNELCFVGVERRKVLKSSGISKTDSRSSPFAASLNAYSVFSNEAAVDVRWDVKLRGFLQKMRIALIRGGDLNESPCNLSLIHI